jgi:predicted ATPase
MINKLILKNFKNYDNAQVVFGPFSVFIGVNASGKSNLRDAFRFLHGISRGYTLSEIIGEKYGEGGVQWTGIRGGLNEIAFHDAQTFSLEVEFTFANEAQKQKIGRYQVEINPTGTNKGPILVHEALFQDDQNIFEVRSGGKLNDLSIYIREGKKKELSGHPVLYSDRTQLAAVSMTFGYEINQIIGFEVNRSLNFKVANDCARQAIKALNSMRFLDLDVNALRLPSLPGQEILGDRGENLSSVLKTIFDDPDRKVSITEWIKALTPMDVVDFEFPRDLTGKILATLVEQGGEKVTAYSASDGTLRFLAYLAAFMGPDRSRLFFIEELENGIHPTRLHLLVELIERKVKNEGLQVIASTHSPQLLRMLSRESLNNASIIYRLDERPNAHIIRILDLPEEIRQVIFNHDVARLYESGWFENTMSFLTSDNSEAV